MSETPVLQLPERLQIQDVAEWKARFVDHLTHHPALIIDGARLTDIDTAGLQLLVALMAESARQGGTARWSAYSAELAESARVLGVADYLNLQSA